jgi:hypothetical protein
MSLRVVVRYAAETDLLENRKAPAEFLNITFQAA